ncbi:hypothetical protein A3B60_02230 [Candidatus Peregrinibacteria bacterium RIFCSPLOWO2_01_FULL_39_12]|nr:MAG: hypothetical protein A3B60_02230 [Candidatus Peregrinibacteria bacterium RIFCSPLOWO2_01_FULL_39_12]
MKKILTIIAGIILFSLAFPLLLQPAYALDNNELSEATFPVQKILKLPGTGTAVDTGGDDSGVYKGQGTAYFEDENGPLVGFALTIMNYATAIMGSIAVILMIIAGFMMMFSQGNQQQLDQAKDIVKYAAIGLIVTFLSYVIVIFVQSVFIAE